MFGNIAPVVVTPHRSLNSSKGVVRNWELARTDPDEIEENIPSIVDVQRIVVKRNNMEIKTNTLILTFNTPKNPESLKVCYLNISVSQFVPNPLRCYRCSETGHKDESCKKAFKCVNCGECHAAYNKKMQCL